MLDRVTRFAAAGRPWPTAARRPAPCGCSTCRRTRPTWSRTRTRGRASCACTGSATTPRPRSSPSWPGWTRCGPTPGCAPRGCCPPRTASGCWPCPTSRSRRRGPGVEPGALRHCVRFEYLPGTEPADDDAAHFAELGEITARMHRHAREWPRPSWFTRFSWDYDDGVRRVAPLGAVAGRHRRRPGRAGRARPAGRRAGPAAGPVRHRAGAVRAGARRHPAGQPAGGRRPGQRHRLRRLRLQLVPLRRRHRR